MKRFDFDRLLRDWIWPAVFVAIVIWLTIWLFSPDVKNEAAQPEPTEEPVIVQMMG